MHKVKWYVVTAVWLLFQTCVGLMMVLPVRAEQASLTLGRAVETALEIQADILLAKQDVLAAKADIQKEQGQFDPVITVDSGFEQARSPLSESLGTEKLRTDTAFIEVEVSKKMENGIILEPKVTLSSLREPVTYSDTQNTADILFSVIIPLMRGKGRDVTLDEFFAVKKEYEAAKHKLYHRAALTILKVVQSFWEYWHAFTVLDLLAQFEADTKAGVQNTRYLIFADVLPAGELFHMEAALESRILARVEGEQKLAASRHALGLAMGLETDQIAHLAWPSARAVEPGSVADKSAWIDPDRFIQTAMTCREDHVELKALLEAEKIRLHARTDDCLPKIDLTLSAGYSGLKEGSRYPNDFIASPVNNIPGASVAAGLSFKLPWHNYEAVGSYIRKQAEYRKAKIRVGDLARRIGSDVRLAVLEYRNLTVRVSGARKALLLYSQALANEREKFELGTSTLTDIIAADQNLLDAKLEELSILRDFSMVIARMAFETGMLVKGKDEYLQVNLGRITSLPETWE